MKVKLNINVEGVGQHGDTVDVPAAQAKWLIDGHYATEVDTPAPAPAPAKPPAKKAGRKAAAT